MSDSNFASHSFNNKCTSVNNTVINCGCSESIYVTYTIEEHLKQFRDDENYKILYECWEVEKKEYENRLKNVNMRYQTYSLHDASHSETILRQIAYFLGEDRIRQLSPTDAWLILESAYCHDLGMVVTAKELFEILSEMREADFEEISKKMYGKDDADVQMAWSYLEPLLNPKNQQKEIEDGKKEITNTKEYKERITLKTIYESKWYEWPVHFSQAFMLLIEEWCRPKHAQLSAQKIREEASEKSYEGLIAHRLRYLIADVAVMHGAQREEVLTKMERTVQGHYLDYAHPRFVAELLRIGDLLDMDNNRFNKYQLAVAGNPSYNTFAHNLKHRALRDFLITPEQIRVKADFEMKDAVTMLNDDTLTAIYEEKIDKEEKKNLEEKAAELTLRAFKELGGWLQWLRQELEFFSVNWFSIIPPHLSGSCPVFMPEKLLLDGREIDNDLLDLRYHITARRSSEIIEGAGLYQDVFVSFIREILQNAMDATKRKLAEELKKIKKTDFINPYDFYLYLSNDLDRVAIKMRCKKNNSEPNRPTIDFIIRDRGIGITHKRLKSMQHIGDTHDYALSKQAKDMWDWWKPTGSFGIGMQTIFYFTKSFTLKTRAEEDNLLRKMNFHSTQVGGKIDTLLINHVKEAEEFGYGTELIIKIIQSNMRLMQEKSVWGENLDYFGDEAEMYQKKVNETIQEIYGSFGIPIYVSNKSNSWKKGYMNKCFGVYFFDLNNEHFCYEVKSDEMLSDKEFSGFSCWDGYSKIFIRYRHSTKKNSKTKIYFNEIFVNDSELNSIVHIPFFETEVYLFDYKAENYLEINRDSFLHEKRRFIADNICHVHLELMKKIVDKQNYEEKISDKAYKYIWQYSNGSEFYKNVCAYTQFVINKNNATFSQIGIVRFVQTGSYIHCLNETDKIPLEEISADNIWLTDIRHKHISDIKISDSYEQRYIIEDVMFDYIELAVTELKCIRDFYNRNKYFMMYKTSSRTGAAVKIDDKDFDIYIEKAYNDIVFENNSQRRMILPGKEEYIDICVARLEDNLGTSFEKRFDSSIIMPIAVKELYKWVLECKSEEEIRGQFSKKYEEHDVSYKKIVDYIKNNRTNKNVRFEDKKINEEYTKLLIKVWHVLRRKFPSE